MLGDPAAEPAHFFLTHFTSLNFDRPLHALSLLSIEGVVQLFLQLSEMRPFVPEFLTDPLPSNENERVRAERAPRDRRCRTHRALALGRTNTRPRGLNLKIHAAAGR